LINSQTDRLTIAADEMFVRNKERRKRACLIIKKKDPLKKRKKNSCRQLQGSARKRFVGAAGPSKINRPPPSLKEMKKIKKKSLGHRTAVIIRTP